MHPAPERKKELLKVYGFSLKRQRKNRNHETVHAVSWYENHGIKPVLLRQKPHRETRMPQEKKGGSSIPKVFSCRRKDLAGLFAETGNRWTCH